MDIGYEQIGFLASLTGVLYDLRRHFPAECERGG